MANYLSDTIKKLQVGISGYTDSTDVANIIGNTTLDGSLYLKSSLKDKDGQPGASGEILASTGTGVEWVSAPPGGISVYDENTLIGSTFGTTSIKFVGNYVAATISGSTATVTFSDLSLDNLTDVVISSPSNNQLVRYNNSNTRWENWTPNFTLGTDTTGNYVANLVAGTGVTLTNGTASEGGTPTVSIGQSVGTTDNVTFNNLTVSGALTINGSTTTINSTITTIDDPIITLGGDTAPAADDSKDRGIEFRWHDGSNAKIGFFGFDDSTGYLTYIPDATNSSEVFSGTLGDIQATNFRGALIGNADTATKWSTKRTLTISGDVSGTATDIDGSGNISITSTLASSGVTAGTYTSVTVDSKGRVTSGTSPTTLGGYGIVDALTTSSSSTQSGYFGNIYLYDDSTPSHYLEITNSANLTDSRTLSVNVNDASRTISLSGDLTVSATATLSGTNTGDQTIELTGDVTGSGTGSFSTTLANSGVTSGTYNNSATAITPFTVDSKGRITSTGSTVTVTPAFSSITSKPTTLSGYGITDALSNSTVSTQSGYFGNIYLYDDSTPSHYLEITNSANLTDSRTLSINVNDADRTISLSGNLTISAAATVSGTNTGDQTIELTGDVTGSGTGSFSTTLANSGVTAGTYTSVTVDAKGRVTAGTSQSLATTDSPSFTTLVNLNNQAELRFLEDSTNGTNYVGFKAPSSITTDKIWVLPSVDGTNGQALITDGSGNLSWNTFGGVDFLTTSNTSTQSGYFGNIFLYDDSTPSHYLEITNSANLTAQRTLSVDVNDADRTISLSGNLTVSASATISGTNTGDQIITLTGDVTGSGTGSFSTTLENSGVTAGTYTSVTVDSKGRVTSGSNPTTIDSPSFTTLVNLNNQAELRFLEASGNGTNYVGFEAPANIAANKIWVLPSVDGTSGQALVTDGSGTLSWAAAGGGASGDGGTFNAGITSSIYVSVTSGIGTTVSELNDITTGPGIAYTFPSTSGKKYIIESIHVTNTFSNELYFVGRHDFNGGSNVPTAQRIVVPYQGSVELLIQPIIANPSDILRFQALSDTTSSATGIDGGLDAFIVYSEKDDTDYIGTGKIVTTASGTEIFQASSNPAVLQSIKLCNYSLNTDVDVSISIYRGSLSTGVRLGYLVYNLTIPKNSTVEILEKSKYLQSSDSIVASASADNVASVTVSGKYIV